MHVCGGGVARLAGVDDDHRAALAPELERGGEPGGRSADDGDVAVSLDGGGGVVAHDLDDTVSTRKCTDPCSIRKTPEDDGRARRDRTGGPHPAAQPSEHAGPVARRARRPDQPQSLHHQPGRDRQADDQPRRPAAAGRRPPGRPRRAPRRAQRRRRGHPPDAEQLGRAHDLDAEPADRQHDRRQDAARTDPHEPRAAGPPRSRLVLRHRGTGAPVARRTRDHRRDRRGRRVRHHDTARRSPRSTARRS